MHNRLSITSLIIFIILVPVVCGAAKRGDSVTIEDFVGRWFYEFIADPENPEDDMINNSFELWLEKDSTQPNALKGWHFSTVRGGRKIDGVDCSEPPSLHGYLRGDTVYLHFVSTWQVEGEAKLYFDPAAQDQPTLIWELGAFESTKENKDNREHYMPRQKALQKVSTKNDR